MITLGRLQRTSLQANVSTWGGLCRACPVLQGMASHLALPPNRPTVRRGAFIVLEGADRAGKSTQCKLLVEYLQALGVAAELWRFPDRTTEIGQMIDAYLASKKNTHDAAIHLLFSANRWEKSDLLREKLQAGTTLVVDRYAYSGAAFTAAKGTPGLNLEWCKACDVGLPAPDAVVYLSLPVDVAEQRGGFGEERYETRQMQTEVGRRFNELNDGTWHVIDASLPLEDVQKQIWNVALETLEHVAADQHLAELWTPSPLHLSASEKRSPLAERSPLAPLKM